MKKSNSCLIWVFNWTYLLAYFTLEKKLVGVTSPCLKNLKDQNVVRAIQKQSERTPIPTLPTSQWHSWRRGSGRECWQTYLAIGPEVWGVNINRGREQTSQTSTEQQDAFVFLGLRNNNNNPKNPSALLLLCTVLSCSLITPFHGGAGVSHAITHPDSMKW